MLEGTLPIVLMTPLYYGPLQMDRHLFLDLASDKTISALSL